MTVIAKTITPVAHKKAESARPRYYDDMLMTVDVMNSKSNWLYIHDAYHADIHHGGDAMSIMAGQIKSHLTANEISFRAGDTKLSPSNRVEFRFDGSGSTPITLDKNCWNISGSLHLDCSRGIQTQRIALGSDIPHSSENDPVAQNTDTTDSEPHRAWHLGTRKDSKLNALYLSLDKKSENPLRPKTRLVVGTRKPDGTFTRALTIHNQNKIEVHRDLTTGGRIIVKTPPKEPGSQLPVDVEPTKSHVDQAPIKLDLNIRAGREATQMIITAKITSADSKLSNPKFSVTIVAPETIQQGSLTYLKPKDTAPKTLGKKSQIEVQMSLDRDKWQSVKNAWLAVGVSAVDASGKQVNGSAALQFVPTGFLRGETDV